MRDALTEQTISLFELCRSHGVVSLIGLSKAAGKTTVLARLIRAYHYLDSASAPLAVTSVGQGGVLPEIRLFAGMFAATAAGALKDCDFTRCIRHTTGMNTPLSEVVITEALSDGRVSLAGPSINSQLTELCAYMLTELGAGQVLVDGAGDRRTFAAASDGVILCAGAAFSRDMRVVARECGHLDRLMRLPKIADIRRCDVIVRKFDGAVTDGIMAELADGAEVKRTVAVAADASRIFAKTATLDRFLHRGGELYVENPANLIAVTVNPAAPGLGYAFDRAEFTDAVRERVSVPVFSLETDYE